MMRFFGRALAIAILGLALSGCVSTLDCFFVDGATPAHCAMGAAR
jgi:hypothetical protein